MKKYLIIAPSWLGDIIMAQTLFKVLRGREKDCRIDVYAPLYSHSILKRMPEVDGILENPFAHGALHLKERVMEGRELKGLNYDSAFILPNSLKSALVPFFAGIKDRRGFKGESRYGLINNMRKNKEDFPRMVERYAALAYSKDEVKTKADLPPLPYPALELKQADFALRQKLNLSPDRPLLGLGCGANYGPSKLWPVEYFAAVCDYWIAKGGRVLGLGTKKDGATVQAIAKCLKPESVPYFQDIAGLTSLTEALDIVGICKAAVCNDSGMMHTVAAAGVPQVCIFGSTSTGYTPPLSDKAVCIESDEPCHPCFKRECPKGTYACQKGILPAKVIAALEGLNVI